MKKLADATRISVTRLTEQLRFVKRYFNDDGSITERLILQQAMQDIETGEITWVDVPVCDE